MRLPGRGRRTSGRGRATPRRSTARPSGRQARRPGPPLHRRLARRLPPLGRALAVLTALAIAAGLVALLNGPWLRVAQVAWGGERYTASGELAAVLEPQRGASVLTVDTRALRDRLQDLPAVAEARVEALLPDGLRATIVERQPAFVWQTTRARFLAADDGTIFAEVPRDAAVPEAVVALPLVDDTRVTSRLLAVGDVLPPALVETAMRLAAVPPSELGSSATHLLIRIDAEYGFLLISREPRWRIAFGFYPQAPRLDAADAADVAARIGRQVTAVRTLFATRPEARIGWVDARNPGKVYFRARG